MTADDHPPTSTELRLMRAAGALFASKGYAAVGIREIAREAGVTIGALYHYAASKEDLFVKLLRRSYARTTLIAQEAAATGATSAERVVNLVRTHVVGEVADSNLWRLNRSELRLLNPQARAELVALRDEFEKIWKRLIDDGVASGEFTPEDPALARFSIIQMCNGVALWYREGGRLTLEEISEVIGRQVLSVLGVTTSPAGQPSSDGQPGRAGRPGPDGRTGPAVQPGLAPRDAGRRPGPVDG